MDVNELETTTPTLSAKAYEDYVLVQRAISGDQRSYAILMDKYKQSIYLTMLKMVNNREDADDLTLEAFGKAFNKLPSYAPRYAFSTWLFKIAINNCIDYIRKKRLHLLSIDETTPAKAGQVSSSSIMDFSMNMKAIVPDPEQEVIKEQRVTHMRKIIGKLSEKYRQMIELRFFEELSYEEIASELDLPLGTVKAQLFRAKELLYGYLQNPVAQAYIEEYPRRERGKTHSS
ncbi:MAG: sigma-70 family RNA polymerase sigma factor [Saprospiraceae bacterium]|nr:sigma-70 family RNA polymerase sigma factor [Saprospiraceae bacterium]